MVPQRWNVQIAALCGRKQGEEGQQTQALKGRRSLLSRVHSSSGCPGLFRRSKVRIRRATRKSTAGLCAAEEVRRGAESNAVANEEPHHAAKRKVRDILHHDAGDILAAHGASLYEAESGLHQNDEKA